MVESELWAGTLGHTSHKIVHLGLTPAPRDQLNVTTWGLEDAANGKELADIVSIDKLLATQDVDEIECLLEH